MTNWSAKQHSYEELRALVIDELLAHTCRNFTDLQEKVSQAILKQNNQWPPRETGMAYPGAVTYLHPNDSSTILEVFWDLFRQGVITLGTDVNNPGWPWFRLSRFGEIIKSQSEFKIPRHIVIHRDDQNLRPGNFGCWGPLPGGSGCFVLRRVPAIRVSDAWGCCRSGVSARSQCGDSKHKMGFDIRSGDEGTVHSR